MIKTNKILHMMDMELDPFLWQNDLYYILGVRTESPWSTKLQVVHFSTGNVISEFGYGLGLMSCIVEGSTLHVFGSTDWRSVGNKVRRLSTTDLVNWTSPVDVISMPADRKCFNTSIAKNPVNGEFVMVVEEKLNSDPYFSLHFFKSTTGVEGAFSAFGSKFGGSFRASCPALFCVNGDYYMTHMTHSGAGGDGGMVGIKPDGIYYTRFNKMNMFQSDWSSSRIPLLAPDRHEGINNSDLGIIEWNGKCYLFYAAGNQSSDLNYAWTYITYATHEGTFDNLLAQYFYGIGGAI